MAITGSAIKKYLDVSEGPARAALKAGPSVWFVIASMRTYDGDVEAVARELDVPVKAVEAAIAYYVLNQRPIEARIELNQA